MAEPNTIDDRPRTAKSSSRATFAVLAGIVGAFALVVGACSSDDGAASTGDAQVSSDPAPGGSTGGSTDESSSDGADAGEATAEGVEMTNVATGESVDLDAALTPEGKPVLAWFWAPHCPTCRGEAPELDAFMAENSDQVDLVGIGSRDDFEYAEGFLTDTGVTNFDLLWEPSGQSWVDNAVAAQPYMILIDADGEEVERWPGGASVTQIENALAEL